MLRSLTESILSEFLEQKKTLTNLAWRRLVRDWVRQQASLCLSGCFSKPLYVVVRLKYLARKNRWPPRT